MPAHELWLPNPPKGTRVCAGFDGSENDDWTCIKMETLDGLIFTPRYGPDRRATIWNPKQWGDTVWEFATSHGYNVSQCTVPSGNINVYYPGDVVTCR